MSVCVRCVVEGKVQGVFFRQSTMRIAQAFGVNGWVRNLSDGNVELLACGKNEDVERLKEWLWQGPLTAEVKDVRCESVEFESHDDFVVTHGD